MWVWKFSIPLGRQAPVPHVCSFPRRDNVSGDNGNRNNCSPHLQCSIAGRNHHYANWVDLPLSLGFVLPGDYLVRASQRGWRASPPFWRESTEAYQQRSTVPLKEINLRKGENRTVNLWCFKKLCSKIIHLYFKHKKNAHNSGELRYSKYICTYRQGKDHTLYC